jgi:hypothetical protein
MIGRVLSPAPRDIWERVLAADPLALESQSPAWADAAVAGGGLEDASRFYEMVDGRQLIVPMLRRRPSLGALSIEGSNLPGWGVGGLLAPGGATAAEHAAVFRDLAARRVLRQTIWPHPLTAGGWGAGRCGGEGAGGPRGRPPMRLRRALVAALRQLLPPRSPPRRAGGVTVESDTTGRLIPEFYELTRQAVERWSRLQHEPQWMARRRHWLSDPRGKFEAIARALGPRCRIWVARVDGRPAASMMVLSGANAYDFRAAMDEQLAGFRANDLLLKAAIEQACAEGCRYYYLGDSGKSASLGQFKQRFGAEAIRYAEYRLERAPLTAGENALKWAVKRAVRFREA